MRQATKGPFEAFAQQVRLGRGRFGSYEPIDFLALLIGYAISGERTLADFFERVEHARGSLHGTLWTPMSSSSLQFESLLGRCRSFMFGSLPQALRAADVRAIRGQRKPLVASSIDRVGATLSLMSMRRAKQRGNVRCPAILSCLLPNADEGAVCAPGDIGRKRGEVVRTRTTALQIDTRQWIGTYAGKGNGDYRGELASALRAITAYVKHFAFRPAMALIRLDGAYGDATVVAQLQLASTPFVTRWRGYLLLEHPQMRAACWLMARRRA